MGSGPGESTDQGYIAPFPFNISNLHQNYMHDVYHFGAYELPAGSLGHLVRNTSFSHPGSPFAGGAGDGFGQNTGAYAGAGTFGSGGGGATVTAYSTNANSGAGGNGIVFFITQTIS